MQSDLPCAARSTASLGRLTGSAECPCLKSCVNILVAAVLEVPHAVGFCDKSGTCRLSRSGLVQTLQEGIRFQRVACACDDASREAFVQWSRRSSEAA
jgi:hypothetical protein